MASVSTGLRAAARSAYRDLFRASSRTFSGDPLVCNAFREKMRQDILAVVDENGMQEYVALTNEIAGVLRKNIVQAEQDAERDVWKLKITKNTELGSNETIKQEKVKLPLSRRQRLEQERQSTSPTSPDAPLNTPSISHTHHSLNYSAMKRAFRQRLIPQVKEEDLEESFVRGSGPGGQSINKTENNVQLLHKPTGIRVSCQETRSFQTNRMLAKRKLIEKLDAIQNPGLSKNDVGRAKQRERERQKRKKAKKKAKQALSEQEQQF